MCSMMNKPVQMNNYCFQRRTKAQPKSSPARRERGKIKAKVQQGKNCIPSLDELQDVSFILCYTSRKSYEDRRKDGRRRQFQRKCAV